MRAARSHGLERPEAQPAALRSRSPQGGTSRPVRAAPRRPGSEYFRLLTAVRQLSRSTIARAESRNSVLNWCRIDTCNTLLSPGRDKSRPSSCLTSELRPLSRPGLPPRLSSPARLCTARALKTEAPNSSRPPARSLPRVGACIDCHVVALCCGCPTPTAGSPRQRVTGSPRPAREPRHGRGSHPWRSWCR